MILNVTKMPINSKQTVAPAVWRMWAIVGLRVAKKNLCHGHAGLKSTVSHYHSAVGIYICLLSNRPMSRILRASVRQRIRYVKQLNHSS